MTKPSELRMASEYQQHRDRYFSVVDADIASSRARSKRLAPVMSHMAVFFAERRGTLHSSGHTTFVVEPIAGWQRYHVSEAKGELEHTLEVAGAHAARLLSFFEKIPSGDDYLNVSLRNPFSLLLKCRFKQMLAADRDSERSTFRFVIVGLTRVSIWPWPSFSNTVYCADIDEIGLVPIAYAVYR